MKLFLKISYLGSAYCGYQVQPNGVSIQQKLNEAAQAAGLILCGDTGLNLFNSPAADTFLREL